MLAKYVNLARRLGVAASSFTAIGTDVVDELYELRVTVAQQFPRAVFFAGQLVFGSCATVDRSTTGWILPGIKLRLLASCAPVVGQETGR
jgi:hypothetical protein